MIQVGSAREAVGTGGGGRGCGRAAVALALASGLLLPAAAEAQIYTRVRNGVVEATNVPTGRDYRLTYPGKGTLIHSRLFRLRPVYTGEFDLHIAAAATAYGVSPDLVRAVIQVESEYDHLAVSSKGAQGLMQLMPDTARRFGVGDPFDPRQNIFGGVQYLRFLLDLFQDDVILACAGYNAGENAVLRHNGVPPYKETQAYVRKIQAILSGSVPLRAASPPRNGGPRTASSPVRPAAFYTPSRPLAARGPSASPARRPAAPRPGTYYTWQDGGGVLHVAHRPPAEGVSYQMLRAQD